MGYSQAAPLPKRSHPTGPPLGCSQAAPLPRRSHVTGRPLGCSHRPLCCVGPRSPTLASKPYPSFPHSFLQSHLPTASSKGPPWVNHALLSKGIPVTSTFLPSSLSCFYGNPWNHPCHPSYFPLRGSLGGKKKQSHLMPCLIHLALPVFPTLSLRGRLGDFGKHESAPVLPLSWIPVQVAISAAQQAYAILCIYIYLRSTERVLITVS